MEQLVSRKNATIIVDKDSSLEESKEDIEQGIVASLDIAEFLSFGSLTKQGAEPLSPRTKISSCA
jgi:hypothetical protein